MKLSDLIPDDQIEAAKARVWSHMQTRLHDRALAHETPVLDALAMAGEESLDRLSQVRMKEQLMDKLPEQHRRDYLRWGRRGVAMSTLAFVFGVLFVPVLDGPLVLADTVNRLDVLQGEVWVNGAPVDGSSLLNPGDQVTTGEDAIAHISFVDDSRMTLAPSSELKIIDTNEMSVVASHLSGEVWVQAVNLMDSELVLQFPDGQLLMDQRGSFNVSIGESTVVEVASNLVNIDISTTQIHRGVLGQGARLVLDDSLHTEVISDEYKKDDLWWSYNISYGKVHARSVDERYHNERLKYARILPGHPLYALKTFREDVQEAFALNEEARQDLIVQHAENRLVEAQVLLASGDVNGAEAALEAYQVKVEAVAEAGNQEQKEAVQNLIESNQKGVLAKESSDEGLEMLEDHLAESAATVADEDKKDAVQLLTASQKLARVPDLVEAGEFTKALQYLSDYSAQSRSILVQLEEVPLEEREVLVATILDRKMNDLHMLRMIAAMPELEGAVVVDAQIYQELSLLVVSLREKTLKHLDDFFASQEETSQQQDVYERLKGSAEISEELEVQFQEVEDQLETASAGAEEVLVDIEVEEILVDPRFDLD